MVVSPLVKKMNATAQITISKCYIWKGGVWWL